MYCFKPVCYHVSSQDFKVMQVREEILLKIIRNSWSVDITCNKAKDFLLLFIQLPENVL